MELMVSLGVAYYGAYAWISFPIPDLFQSNSEVSFSSSGSTLAVPFSATTSGSKISLSFTACFTQTMPQKSQHSCFQNHFPVWQHHTGKLLPKVKRKRKLLVIVSHGPNLSPHKVHAHTSVKRKNKDYENQWVSDLNRYSRVLLSFLLTFQNAGVTIKCHSRQCNENPTYISPTERIGKYKVSKGQNQACLQMPQHLICNSRCLSKHQESAKVDWNWNHTWHYDEHLPSTQTMPVIPPVQD